MTMARRGIFGMLAALPFVPKRAVAASPAEVTVTLKTESFDPDAFRAEFDQHLNSAWGRMPTLFPGERIVTFGADVLNDRIEFTPYGWGTLENVR